MALTEVLGVIAGVTGIVSAISSAVSAHSSRKAASASSKTARESREALAYATRPYFSVSFEQQDFPNDRTDEVAQVRNTAAFEACEVKVAVRSETGRIVGQGSLPAMPGQVPNTFAGDPPLTIDLDDLAKLEEVGDTRKLIATIRAVDQQRILMWEQQFTVIRTITSGVDGTPDLRCVNEPGEPRRIGHA